jgi:hypothetical protein
MILAKRGTAVESLKKGGSPEGVVAVVYPCDHSSYLCTVLS